METEEGVDPNDFVLNDAINTLYDKTKKDKDAKWKNNLIIGSVIGLFVIIILIVILIFVIINNKSDENKEIIGELDCYYRVDDVSQKTQILGVDFSKEHNQFDIYIESTKISYAKEYKFKEVGSYNVYIRIYSDMNLDNMFKDVKALTSVVFISSKNAKILSMKSTFENCVNLYSVSISGFDTSSLISLNRLFYNTAITALSLNDFSTSNIEDFSYMFAFVPKDSLDLSKFDTSKAKNMSHMFYKSTELSSLDLTKFKTENVIDMSHMFESCESLTN